MKKDVVAILIDIRSAHNAGSMFRTADGAGVRKLYLCGYTPGPLDRFGRVRKDFQKTALGAGESVAWEAGQSAARIITALKKEGYHIYVIEQSPGVKPYTKMKTPKNGKVAFVVGNEVAGVPPEVVKQADAVYDIPMLGAKESLNVSVAFGIIAYQLLK